MEQDKFDRSKIKYTDYSKVNEFKRIGYNYTKIYENDKFLVWKMSKEGVINNYFEVWKKIWRKQADGTPYLKSPSDEEFGSTAWNICGNLNHCKNRIKELFSISIL